MRDEVFKKPVGKQFEFDSSVASVFDDMIGRSVPFYGQTLELVSSLVSSFAKDEDVVLDLGCSTANTLLKIYQKADVKLELIGLDNANAMLEIARQKALAYGAKLDLRFADMLECELPESNFIISNYTLQFIRPLDRASFVQKIYNSLRKNGLCFISEKIIYEDKKLDKQMIEMYKNFKKTQGYSEFEISQKREALENILVPYTEEENVKMLQNAGFKSIQSIMKWGNFMTFLCIKA